MIENIVTNQTESQPIPHSRRARRHARIPRTLELAHVARAAALLQLVLRIPAVRRAIAQPTSHDALAVGARELLLRAATDRQRHATRFGRRARRVLGAAVQRIAVRLVLAAVAVRLAVAAPLARYADAVAALELGGRAAGHAGRAALLVAPVAAVVVVVAPVPLQNALAAVALVVPDGAEADGRLALELALRAVGHRQHCGRAWGDNKCN